MTRKILQWLQDNEAQLQDIDYADGVDHCDVKTLVYRRPDITEAWWKFATKKGSGSNLNPISCDRYAKTDLRESNAHDTRISLVKTINVD